MKSDDNASHDKVRLDKWLWAARFFKTRELCIKAVKLGKVLYDNQKANPSREVRIGAVLTIEQGEVPKTVKVLALSAKRLSAPQAALLYEETPESLALREKMALKRLDEKFLRVSAPVAKKRPEKNARRKMRDLRRQDE
jgi:ribosome-associated heat shock protein Hsp15